MTACAEATRDDDGISLEWSVQMLINSNGLTFAVIAKKIWYLYHLTGIVNINT